MIVLNLALAILILINVASYKKNGDKFHILAIVNAILIALITNLQIKIPY